MIPASRILFSQPKRLRLVTMSEHDTDRPISSPETLAASDSGASYEVMIPKASSLPSESRPLPKANPDSFLEMAMSKFLSGVEKLDGFQTLLDAAVAKLNADADARSQARTEENNHNFELTNHEVHKCLNGLDELRATLNNLAPRVSNSEGALQRLELEINRLRGHFERRLTQLEADYRALRDHVSTPPPPDAA